jgi:uncharacterized protein (DUF1778 family)
MSTKTARFEIRWPQKQKELFEKAASIAGYRSLAEFVTQTVQEQTIKVMQQNDVLVQSNHFRDLLFDRLTNPLPPNAALLNISKKHAEVFGEQ